METISILLFSSFPFQLMAYYSISSSIYNDIISLSSQSLIFVSWENGYIIYRNNRISSKILFEKIQIVFGDFIPIIGAGYLSGYSSNSLSIQYFNYPKISISFYLSPSDSYINLISRGFFIRKYFFEEDKFFISFLYDVIEHDYGIIIGANLKKLNLIFFYKNYEEVHLVRAGNNYFNNQNQIYYAFSYSFNDSIKLIYEQKIFFLINSLFFVNYFFCVNFLEHLFIRIIHKEVYQSAEYYFSNGEYYQIIIKLNSLSFGLSYKKNFYDGGKSKINFELNAKKLYLNNNKDYISFYYSVISDIKQIEDQSFYYSIYLNSKIIDNIYFILGFSSSLLIGKIDFYFKDKQRIIIQIFKNLSNLSSNPFSLPQISIYDSYDFYIPANHYGIGMFYFIYLFNLKLAIKVISTFSDNEIGKVYLYYGIFSSF